MKTTISLVAMLVITFSAIAITVANDDSDEGRVSVLALKPSSPINLQDEAEPPVPAEAAVQEPVAPVEPVAQDPVAPIPDESQIASPSDIVMDSVVMNPPMTANSGCASCCQPRCCCPPSPKRMKYCLVDPCGCSHEACVCVPGCCLGEEPCITWRKGIFGRQIATLCWKCCGHSVRVVVCRSGRVIVRG